MTLVDVSAHHTPA